jgi:transketolase
MENKIINTLKFLSLDMIDQANSGHPGMPLGCANLIFILWSKILYYNPNNPEDINRDRFVLSNGHGCALLYSMLHLLGFDYSIEDLKSFRKLNSKTPGHPEFNQKLGIECTTGPLGQGIANGVGMAIASKKMKIDNSIYIMCGDGCLMEGISYEACSLAGHLNLDNIIILYDDNKITIDGNTNITFTENINQRFLSMNWNVFEVKNGNTDNEDIFNKISLAKKSKKPSIVIVKTIIGYGSPLENTSKAHGAPFGNKITNNMKQYASFETNNTFSVDNDIKDYFQKLKQTKILEFKTKNINILKPINTQINFINEKKICSTRELSGKIIKEIVTNNNRIIIGSADLSESNKIPFSDSYITQHDFDKPYIHFGVREHSMVAIANGISTYGFIPIVGTFLMFINYCLASIRLSALSNHQIIYVLTHDSVFIGEDGPTHQPIESLTILRSIPNLITIRPCNNNEVKQAYKYSLINNGPTAIVLSRHNFNIYENNENNIQKGAYIIHKEIEELKYIIVATGSEVPLAIDIANEIKNTRVISMFSCELFNKQDEIYKKSILPTDIIKISIEAGSDIGWYKYVDYCYGINSFGESGHLKELISKFNFTKENIIEFIKTIS